MNIKLIYTVTLLTVLWMTSLASSQDTKSGNNSDPFGSSNNDPFGDSNLKSGKQEDPFGPPNPNETKEQKQARIIGSQNATIKSQKQQIDRLKWENHKARSREQFAMEMSLKTIQTMLNHHDISNQAMGLRLLETFFERAEPNGLSIYYEAKLVRFCTSNLKSLVGSDSPEIQASTIQILERFPSAAGAHFGFQPINGYWHPINDSMGKTGAIRREMLTEGLVFGSQEGSLASFLTEVSVVVGIGLDHDHDVDLEKTKIEFELFDANTFELLDAALIDHNLGYAIVGDKIKIRRLGSDELVVTQLFNVRGLLNKETDLARIISIVKSGIKNANDVVEVDRYRLMVSGTEQQLRKVSQMLGLLAAPSQIPSNNSGPKNQTVEKIKADKSPNHSTPPKKTAESAPVGQHTAMNACNQILAAIQNNDLSALQKWCRPKDVPSTDDERKEFAMAMTEMKEMLRTKRDSVLELREGRSSTEFLGLIEVVRGEAFVIVVDQIPVDSTPNDQPSKGYFFRGIKSPGEEDYQNLKLIQPKSIER